MARLERYPCRAITKESNVNTKQSKREERQNLAQHGQRCCIICQTRETRWSDDVWWLVVGVRRTVGIRWVVRWCRSTIGRYQVSGEWWDGASRSSDSRCLVSGEWLFTWHLHLTLKVLLPCREVSFHVITWNGVAWRETVSRHFTSRHVTVSRPVTDL